MIKFYSIVFYCFLIRHLVDFNDRGDVCSVSEIHPVMCSDAFASGIIQGYPRQTEI